MRIDACNLCGTPKTERELGNGQAACPHCDRLLPGHVASTCSLRPCIEFETGRRAKEAQ